MDTENKPLDPLTAAKIAKEQKAAAQKGKHRAVSTSTIGRTGKIQGKGGMSFTDGEEGVDASKVVKTKKKAGFSFQKFFQNGAVAVGSVEQPGATAANSDSDSEN